MEDGNKVINIDETWLTESDFRRRKWKQRGSTNSKQIKEFSTRISMIAAIDNFGEMYVSLTQVNTDSNVLSMFLVKLANILTK